MMIPWLEPNDHFPETSFALTAFEGADGLLAVGADLSPQRLLDAYRQGIFPWFSSGQPILWWSTNPRMVLQTADFKISCSLQKTLRKIERERQHSGHWKIRFDYAFEEVMRACAAPRKGDPGTWISEEIIEGYAALHRQGYAHSSELWYDEQLVGGAYGVCIGRMFYGESMFARITDGSKVALAYLVHFLKENDVPMIDCQQQTSHLASLGASAMPRAAFIKQLQQLTTQPPITQWTPIGLFDHIGGSAPHLETTVIA